MKKGQKVIKTMGLPFGGVPCRNCGHQEFARIVVIYGGGDSTRVVVQHPEGWQHIFSPNQIVPVTHVPKPYKT